MARNFHTNGTTCSKCNEILKAYPLPPESAPLTKWFLSEQLRLRNLHVSCAGRGEVAQNNLQRIGASRAKWGQSAHNYGVALDVFFLDERGKLTYSKEEFNKLQQSPKLVWYGAPRSKFPELPHFELRGWQKMNLKLVE